MLWSKVLFPIGKHANFFLLLDVTKTNLDSKLPPGKKLAVHAVDRVVRISLVHEAHERKAPRLACAKVSGHVHVTDVAVPLER